MSTTPQIQEVPIRIYPGREPQGTATTGSFRIQVWDAPARTRRALKALAICWGVGLFGVLIPLIHFVLVPVMALAGPVLAAFRWRQESAGVGGAGICPHCAKGLPIARSPVVKFPFLDLCAACKGDVCIERASA